MQAMAPAALFILGLVLYTGFTIPVRDMHPWFKWISYIDPVAYAFEALMINEVGFDETCIFGHLLTRHVSLRAAVSPARDLCQHIQM